MRQQQFSADNIYMPPQLDDESGAYIYDTDDDDDNDEPNNNSMLPMIPDSPISPRSCASMDICVAPRKGSSGRSVTFFPLSSCRQIKHIDEYTEEEILAIWYSVEEEDQIERECIETLKLMMHHVKLDPETHCTRGLEFKTIKGAEYKRKVKDNLIHKVMDEQDIQFEMGTSDPEYIAKISKKASLDSRKIAHVLAIKDAEAVGAGVVRSKRKSRKHKSKKRSKDRDRKNRNSSSKNPSKRRSNKDKSFKDRSSSIRKEREREIHVSPQINASTRKTLPGAAEMSPKIFKDKLVF